MLVILKMTNNEELVFQYFNIHIKIRILEAILVWRAGGSETF